MSRIDVSRMENMGVTQSYSTEGQSAMSIAQGIKQGLVAIAYAITDHAEATRQLAEATRNPEWMKP